MTQPPDITKLPGAPPIDSPCLVIVRPLPRLRGTDAVAALTAEQRMRALTTSEVTRGIDISATRTKKPRRPRLVSVAKQASKAAIAVARYEVKPDGTVIVVTGKPEPAEPENPWPLDEFRTKETKQ
jgi:hypothetical protein